MLIRVIILKMYLKIIICQEAMVAWSRSRAKSDGAERRYRTKISGGRCDNYQTNTDGISYLARKKCSPSYMMANA